MPHAALTSDQLDALMPFGVNAADQRVEFVTPPTDLDFDRPFWHMTMEELSGRDRSGDLAKTTVDFAALRHAVGPQRPAPVAMVFHIGRCGSTLVSRMIGHDRSKLVLREAAPLGGLHRASGGSDLVPTFTIEQAVLDMLVAFDRFAATRGQRVIVKHSSWESFSMERIAELLPQTRIVFVCRNPIETVESSLDGHPAWAARIHEPRGLLQRWVPWLDHVEPPFTAAEIYASVWASGVDAALRLGPQRLRIVDHARLVDDPRTEVDRLRSFLDLDLDLDLALSELGQYSKSKSDGVEFDPDGIHGHPALSPWTRRRIDEVLGDLRDRLDRRLDEQD